jgi:hypothetical protein
MSKKSKRQSRRDSVSSQQSTLSAQETSATGAPSKITDFKPDYTYVIKDLRRIGMLVGSFIVILVILTFFLR